MKPFVRGFISLIDPIDVPPRKSAEEIEKAVWEGVGTCLYEAMGEYGKTEEYKKSLTTKNS